MPVADDPEDSSDEERRLAADGRGTGDGFDSLAHLFHLCFRELRRIAERIGAGEVGHTMQPTALLNETYLKLFERHGYKWGDQTHFLCFAARTMASILVDYKRRRGTRKRGGKAGHLPLDEVLHAVEANCGGDVVAVHDALERLAHLDQRTADYVMLRFFGGYTNTEASRTLGMCDSDGSRCWKFASRWLHAQLTDD